MGQSLRDDDPASHREQLASVHPTPAKAELRPQASASRLREVAAETIRSVAVNQRAAAIDMRIHEAHLSRSLRDGTLRLEQLETLGPAFAAKFGEELVREFGPLSDPKAAARKSCEQIEDALRTLRQYVEVSER